MLSRRFAHFPPAFLMLVGWLVLLLVWPDDFEPWAAAIVNLLLGTLYALTTIAAAWLALGPGRLLVRLPGSILVTAVNLFCLLGNLEAHGEPLDGAEYVLAACLLLQWLLVQVPLWLIAIGYGVRLRHREEIVADRPLRQFDIRQLLIVTTVVAVLLALGRVLVGRAHSAFAHQEWLVLLFLNVVAVIVSLPLLLAALLPRFALPAVVGVGILVAIFTAWEAPLKEQLALAGGPPAAHFVLLNTFTCLWVLAFVLCLRLSGYGIGMPRLQSTGADLK
jgi:hypothetical protein